MKSSRVESWVRMGNGYESLYYISNQGRIVNIKTGLEENRNHAPRVRLRNRMGVEFDYDVSSLVSSNFKPGVIGFMWGYEGKEKWREIPGYPKYYKVSNLGRVIGRDCDFPTDYPPGTILVDEGHLFDTLENRGWIKSLLDPEVQKKRIEKYKKILAGEEEDFYLIEHWKKEGLELTPEAIIEDDIKFATNWLIEHES